uniref:Integrase core domain-containing protein n=3 Tax=Candidatus Kentrum sp. FM TaxID=2126340 RepID=A0A450TFV6_9GAMM|nr:MAG: hypothetical protein BECKFM1743C_GA0114222_104114 [Candidatus Kentron sp. FM]
MNDTQIKTLEQIRQFLSGTLSVEFSIDSKDESYRWIERTLIRLGYRSRSKVGKGLVLDFIEKVSGYSRVQTKRLVKQYLETGRIRRRQCTRKGFTRKYTNGDIRLLARTDELHGSLSGLLPRSLVNALSRFLNRLNTSVWRSCPCPTCTTSDKARLTATYALISIKPVLKPPVSANGANPNPDGYFRVDTVHQGDLDGVKGVYYINAVDEITQFEIVCSVEKISERYLIPVLEALLDQFPFVIVNFHTD